MLFKEKSRVTPVLYLLLTWAACGVHPAAHAFDSSDLITSANAVIRPEAVEKALRAAAAEVLNGDASGAGLSFKTQQKIDQKIPLPATKGQLKEILSTLGIQNSVTVVLSPLQAKFVLPPSALKIGIQQLQPNRFQIQARWSITQLNAKSDQLVLQVPKGFFDKGFDIVSRPIQVGLAPKSKPITVELTMLADLTGSGTKIHLASFTTNLNSGSSKPDLFIQLGKLTVGGKPLELEIRSNGKSLIADEASIRAQLQKLEPDLVQTVREKLSDLIQDQFSHVADVTEGQPPLRYSMVSDTLLKKMNLKPPVQKLLSGISMDMVVSYLQYLKKDGLFTAQIATRTCLSGFCVGELDHASPISTEDLKSIDRSDEVGILVYESWLQDFFHSDLFQKRILDFYNTNKSPGVDLSKTAGVRVHLNPTLNSVDVVLNLEIDIKKTGDKDSRFGDKVKRKFGDLWENWFGSGKIVKIPVEIHGRIQGIQKNASGQSELVIAPELPFKNGTVINTYGYPDNVDEMTKLVKSDFLDSVKDDIAKSIPPMIRIPLGDGLTVGKFKLMPKKLVVTKNHGLLITAEAL